MKYRYWRIDKFDEQKAEMTREEFTDRIALYYSHPFRLVADMETNARRTEKRTASLNTHFATYVVETDKRR
jgi:hypothetical protein